MRTIPCVRAGWLVAALGACIFLGGAARADTTTERPGSILIFPKVVTTGTRDTVIQVTNTGNMPDDVRCFYVNGETCLETNFFLSLTRQQPTHWQAGAGRTVNPQDQVTGLDAGVVPPLPPEYAGALVCVEVDASDKPIIRNQLKGEATIVDNSGSSSANDVAKYNAVAIQGMTGDGNNTLQLDGSEYSACPSSLVLNFAPDGSTDPVIEALGNGGRCVGGMDAGAACNNNANCQSNNCATGQSLVANTLTLVPCNLDFVQGIPTTVALSFKGSDENEVSFSSSVTFSCWASINLGDIVTQGQVATPFGTVGMTSTSGGPVLAVAETFHSDSVANTASAAVNLHAQSLCNGGTRNGQACNRDGDCSGGTCGTTAAATIQLSDQ